jgi:predicted transcriptional regulator
VDKKMHRQTESQASSQQRGQTRAERAAAAVLAAAKKEFTSLEEPWDSYVIDVELIATLLYSLGVQRVRDLRIGQRAYAGLLDGQARLIAVEGLDATVRQRFSIAHELGHFVLHYLPQPSGRGLFTCTAQDMAVTSADLERLHLRQELEANQFAAALLMPEAAVRAMHQVVGGRLFALSRHFQVSHQAMEIRLNRIGLPVR